MRDDYERFTDLGAEILAIAPESMSAAEKFLGSNPLPYPLLVDDRHTACEPRRRLAPRGSMEPGRASLVVASASPLFGLRHPSGD